MSITICPLSTASSILPIFTSDLDRRAVPGLLDVGYGQHAKSAGLMPEGPPRSTRKRRERRRRVGFGALQPIGSGRGLGGSCPIPALAPKLDAQSFRFCQARPQRGAQKRAAPCRSSAPQVVAPPSAHPDGEHEPRIDDKMSSALMGGVHWLLSGSRSRPASRSPIVGNSTMSGATSSSTAPHTSPLKSLPSHRMMWRRAPQVLAPTGAAI